MNVIGGVPIIKQQINFRGLPRTTSGKPLKTEILGMETGAKMGKKEKKILPITLMLTEFPIKLLSEIAEYFKLQQMVMNEILFGIQQNQENRIKGKTC